MRCGKEFEIPLNRQLYHNSNITHGPIEKCGLCAKIVREARAAKDARKNETEDEIMPPLPQGWGKSFFGAS